MLPIYFVYNGINSGGKYMSNLKKYTFNTRTFVDSTGHVVEYYLYHREENDTLYLSINEGCYDYATVNELFLFLADLDLFVFEENSNWWM